MAKEEKSQSKEIIWNIVNACLAGGLVFLGACSAGNITFNSIVIAFVTAGIIIITKFTEYWKSEESEYSNKLFNFIN